MDTRSNQPRRIPRTTLWHSQRGATAAVGTAKSPTLYYIYRSLLPFDTSSIPDSATITSATLSAYVASKMNYDNDGDDFITLVQSTQASSTALATTDYARTGATNNPTEGVDSTGRKDITSITANAWLTFTLNTTGQGFVSKTGSTLLALREGHDVIDSLFVSTSTTASQQSYVTFHCVYRTTYDPLLTVTYTETSTTASAPTVARFDLHLRHVDIDVDASDQVTAKLPATPTMTYP